MKLEERIESEFKAALKAREAVKVSTLRMVKAAVNNLAIEKKKNTLNDDEILSVIEKQVKQHRESIEQFAKGNRQDLVDKEKKELEILLAYMPEQLPEEEVEKIVKDTIKKLGVSTKKDMGNVMKAVMAKVKGKADGKTVSRFVSSNLS